MDWSDVFRRVWRAHISSPDWSYAAVEALAINYWSRENAGEENITLTVFSALFCVHNLKLKASKLFQVIRWSCCCTCVIVWLFAITVPQWIFSGLMLLLFSLLRSPSFPESLRLAVSLSPGAWWESCSLSGVFPVSPAWIRHTRFNGCTHSLALTWGSFALCFSIYLFDLF